MFCCDLQVRWWGNEFRGGEGEVYMLPWLECLVCSQGMSADNGMQNEKEVLSGSYEGSAGDGGREEWRLHQVVFYRAVVRIGDWI